MGNLISDLRYAMRSLLARRSFTFAVLLTLAPSIGMTTAVYSFLEGVVLRPLPYRNADRLISLCEQFPSRSSGWCGISPPDLYDIRAGARSIEKLGLARQWSVTMLTPTGREQIPAGIATDQVFEALGIHAAMGRLIEAGDLTGRPGSVAVISHGMWEQTFGSAPDIVGRTITLDGDPVTIVGVLEAGAVVPELESPRLWRPLHFDPRDEKNRDWRGFIAFGLRREGQSLAAVDADVQRIARDLRPKYFTTTAGWGIETHALKDLVVGSVRTPMYLFFGAVLLVLLIACANVANLLLARGEARSREMAIRSAIGANRTRIVRALLAESLLLALGGTVLGLGLSQWITPFYRSLAPELPRLEQVGTNGAVVTFTVLLMIGTAVLFGLAPALRLSRVNLAQSLREGGRSGIHRGRLGRLLVVAEVAVALPLVTSAALLSRSFVAQSQWRPGFDREHLLTFSIFAPTGSYKGAREIPALWDRIEQGIAAVPGVRAVGTSSAGPLYGGYESWEMDIEGLPATEKPAVRWYDVSPGFFTALGVPIVRGRDFDANDAFGAPDMALVNETLANRYWPGQNPVGKHLTYARDKERATWTVKGVVRDIPPIKAGEPVLPQLYWSNRQSPRPFTFVLVRTSAPPASVLPMIRDRLKEIGPEFAPSNVATMPELVEANLRVPKFGMTLMLAFGLAAIVMTGIGTYGLLAYLVEQRQREIGVRLALGAPRGSVLWRVIADGLALAIPGAAIGLAGSVMVARVIRSFVFGLSPSDPLSLAGSAALLLGVAVLACAVPALRASRVDPAGALAAD